MAIAVCQIAENLVGMNYTLLSKSCLGEASGRRGQDQPGRTLGGAYRIVQFDTPTKHERVRALRPELSTRLRDARALSFSYIPSTNPGDS